jgi:hypothetical protein
MLHQLREIRANLDGDTLLAGLSPAIDNQASIERAFMGVLVRIIGLLGG